VLISVITPSMNGGDAVRETIRSVLAQSYPHYEHIVVNGGSPDGMAQIASIYPHLRCISQTSGGMEEAMNNGFKAARGDVVAYLTAGDCLLDTAFSAVIPLLKAGADVVAGPVKVVRNDGTDWINTPKTDLESVMRHWETNVSCIHWGYFIRRRVQEELGFDLQSGSEMGLKFLMEAVQRFRVERVQAVLGTCHESSSRKACMDRTLYYWRSPGPKCIEQALRNLPASDQKRFLREQEHACQTRRREIVAQAAGSGTFEGWCRDGTIIRLPTASTSGVIEYGGAAVADGDAILLVLSHGKAGSKSVQASVEGLGYPLYHLHYLSNETISANLPSEHALWCLAVRRLFDRHGKRLNWKIISGVRDPIAFSISAYFENHSVTAAPTVEEIERYTRSLVPFWRDYYDKQVCDVFGVDVFETRFDPDAGYALAHKDNVEIVVYQMEALDRCFVEAMEALLGTPNLTLRRSNETSAKSYADVYRQVVERTRMPDDLLDLVYESRYCRHFYSQAQLAFYRKRWQAPLPE
jgi:hypothetical protein